MSSPNWKMPDIKSLCRLCGASGGNTELEVSLLDSTWKHIFDELTGSFCLEIDVNNNFPTRICRVCLKIVEDYVLLKKKRHVFHKYFCSLLKVPVTCGVIQPQIKNKCESKNCQQSENVTKTQSSYTQVYEQVLKFNAASPEVSPEVSLEISPEVSPEVISAQVLFDSPSNVDMTSNDKEEKIEKPKKTDLVLIRTDIKEVMSSQLSNCQPQIEPPSDQDCDQDLGYFILEQDIQEQHNQVQNIQLQDIEVQNILVQDIEVQDILVQDIQKQDIQLQDIQKPKITPFSPGFLKDKISTASNCKENRTMLMCHICGQKICRSRFKIHVKSHKNMTSIIKDCSIVDEKLVDNKCEVPTCGVVSVSEQSLKRHILASHSLIYACDYCNQKFDKLIDKKNHTKSHHSTNTNVWKCLKCDEVFRSPFNFKRHQSVIHYIEYSCDTCGKIFESDLLFLSHLTSTNHAQNINCIPSDIEPKCKRFKNITIELQNDLDLPTETMGWNLIDREPITTENEASGGIDNASPITKLIDMPKIKLVTEEMMKPEMKTQVVSTDIREENILNEPHVERTDCSPNNYETETPENLFDLVTVVYKCKYCSSVFKTKRLTKLHEHYVHLAQPVQECDNCGKCFLTSDDKETHIKRNACQLPFSAEKYIFTSETMQVETPSQLVQDKEDAMSNQQNENIAAEKPIQPVKSLCHNNRRDINVMKCEHCNLLFESSTALNIHLQYKHKQLPLFEALKCELSVDQMDRGKDTEGCNKEVEQSNPLVTEIPDNLKSSSCEDHYFKSSLETTEYEEVVLCNSEIEFVPLSTHGLYHQPSSPQIIWHLEDMTCIPVPVFCSTLESANEPSEPATLQPTQLKVSSKQKKKKTKKKFKCPSCVAHSYTSAIGLKKHLTNVHHLSKELVLKLIPELYQCGYCKEGCTSASSLKTHIHATHNFSFHCPICSKRFRTEKELASHNRNYKNTKHATHNMKCFLYNKTHPVQCDICYKRFSSTPNMMQHMLMAHPKIKQMYCAYCYDNFSKKDDLLDHLKTEHLINV